MDRNAVIDLLEHMAVLLELNGENPFKIRAYQNGARALEGVEGELAEAVRTGALKQVKGIGAGLFADIKTLVETGGLPAYDALVAKTPPGLLEMLDIPGVGPKKVKAIHEGLGITTIGELEYACLENRLVDLPGFGAKTQTKILKSIETWKKNRGKSLYAEALPVAEALVAAIAALPGIERADMAGAMRRKAEIVEGIELVVASASPEATLEAIAGLALVEEAFEAKAETRAFKLKSGQIARVTALPADRYGLGLLLATGSEAFLAGLAARATARGLSWPPAGAWPEEAALFEALALPVVP
ncbi:MAG: helix-hairpin-helix domain-containing protein, partial [Candidatus Sericytochromatia bacterium]